MDKTMSPAHQLGYLLNHVSLVLSQHIDQVLQEQLGIGLSQFKIMMALGWNPHVQQRKLASSLGQTEASISRQVKLLQARGLLLTRINPAERRQHLTEITAKGYKVAEAAREIIGQHHEPLVAALDGKRAQQFLEDLVTVHAQVCTSDNPHACNHPLGI